MSIIPTLRAQSARVLVIASFEVLAVNGVQHGGLASTGVDHQQGLRWQRHLVVDPLAQQLLAQR